MKSIVSSHVISISECWDTGFTFDVIRFSAPSTTPSFVKIPTQDPAFEIASMAYLHQNEIVKCQIVDTTVGTL